MQKFLTVSKGLGKVCTLPWLRFFDGMQNTMQLALAGRRWHIVAHLVVEHDEAHGVALLTCQIGDRCC